MPALLLSMGQASPLPLATGARHPAGCPSRAAAPQCKAERLDREGTLDRLATTVEGVYVPQFYESPAGCACCWQALLWRR